MKDTPVCGHGSQPPSGFFSPIKAKNRRPPREEQGCPHGARALTVAAVLLDGVGGQLDGVLARVLLGEHQLLHLTLCVQDCDLEDCGDRGRQGTQGWGFVHSPEARAVARGPRSPGRGGPHRSRFVPELALARLQHSPTFCLAARKRAGSLTLSASRKAPSSRTSRSMVAVCTCSVAFMSFQDSRASGRSRLSTVSTTACNGAGAAP